MALSPEERNREIVERIMSPRGQYVAPVRVYSSLASDVMDAAKKLAQEHQAVSAAKADVRPDPLSQKNAKKEAIAKYARVDCGKRPGENVVTITPEDEVYYANKQAEKNQQGAAYAIGFIEPADGDLGYLEGPFPTLEMAEEAIGLEETAIFLVYPLRASSEDEIVDVWEEAHWSPMSGRVPPGWAMKRLREECREIMAKAAAPKKSFAPAVAKGATAPAPVRSSPPRAVNTEEDQTEGDGSAEDGSVEETPAPSKPAVSKRPIGAAPSHQEGETLEDLKSRMAKANDGREQVFIAIGKTLNIGNYESIRLDVGLCRPLAEGQTVEALKGDVATEVFELYEALIEEIKGAVNEGKM